MNLVLFNLATEFHWCIGRVAKQWLKIPNKSNLAFFNETWLYKF